MTSPRPLRYGALRCVVLSLTIQFLAASTAHAIASNMISYPVASAAASSHDDAGHVASLSIDGRMGSDSRWSAHRDGEWLFLDLGSKQTVNGLAIAFFKGDSRRAEFTIQSSLDAFNWTTLRSHSLSSGKTSGFENFSFSAVDASYIRIIGHGNSVDQWNSILEVYPFYLPQNDSTPLAVAALTAKTPFTVNLSWTNPVMRDDGSALASDDIQSYDIHIYEKSAPNTPVKIVQVEGKREQLNLTLPNAGQYTFYIACIDKTGRSSSLSTYASITIK